MCGRNASKGKVKIRLAALVYIQHPINQEKFSNRNLFVILLANIKELIWTCSFFCLCLGTVLRLTEEVPRVVLIAAYLCYVRTRVRWFIFLSIDMSEFLTLY